MATNALCTQSVVSRLDQLAKGRRACFVGLAASLLLVPWAYPQQYVEYPQHQGKVQPLELKWVPSWATLDMDLRERTEAQTALNYLPGNLQVYDLTRVRGGLAVRPLPWATGYIQFSDNHVPGLPSKYVAANMRDQFDARQAYLLLHRERATLIVGRQELKYGGERLLGISDWTNNSRTFDGFLGRYGERNRLDLFSSSVVAVHPTSLDTHGAGLTFHGAVGTMQTWVPRTTVQPFVFVKALPRVSSQQSIFGTETEVTPGAEVVGNLMGGIDYDGLAALQRAAIQTIRSAPPPPISKQAIVRNTCHGNRVCAGSMTMLLETRIPIHRGTALSISSIRATIMLLDLPTSSAIRASKRIVSTSISIPSAA